MRRNAPRSTAAVLIAAAFAAAAWAGHGFGPHGPGHGPEGPGHILHMAKQLGLTEEQTSQVRAIVARYMEGSLGQAMESMHEAREALARTIHDVAASDDAVGQAAAAVSALESQIAVERHHMVIEISALLTPEQKARLEDLVKERRERGADPPASGRPGF